MRRLFNAIRSRPAETERPEVESPPGISAEGASVASYRRRAPEPAGPLDAAMNELLKLHGVAYAALTSSAGEFLAEAGDPRKLRYGDLVSSLLGPRGSAQVTYDSLEDQLLPQSFGQGEDYAIADRPRPGLLLVFFGRVDRTIHHDAVGLYAWCESVTMEFRRRIDSLLP